MTDRIVNVTCICGSLREASYNRMVMNALPVLAPPNMRLTEAPPFAEFPLYNFDTQEASGIPPAVQKLADAIRAADGVIFNSPEYNFSMPGGLKTRSTGCRGCRISRLPASRSRFNRRRMARSAAGACNMTCAAR